MHKQKEEFELRKVEYYKEPKVCEWCNKIIPYENRKSTYCNRSCAASNSNKQRLESGWVLSDDIRQQISKKLAGREGHHKLKGRKFAEYVNKTCGECHKDFLVLKSASDVKNYCSPECGRKNVGGYREGSGRSKNGYYKGVYCGSTYELVWVIYRLDHDLTTQRFTGCLVGNGIKYFPDFIDNNTIIEIKGYWTEQVDCKTTLAIQHGYEIEVLYKEDLKVMFDYVKQNYQYKHLEELYDTYKPAFVYVCDWCKTEFTSIKKRTTDTKCCSRSCSMKLNKQLGLRQVGSGENVARPL